MPELLDLLQERCEINGVGLGRVWPQQPESNEGSTPTSKSGAAPFSSSAARGEPSSTTGGASSSDSERTLFTTTPRGTRSASHSTTPSPVQTRSRNMALRNGGGAHFVQDDGRGQGGAVDPRKLRELRDMAYYIKSQASDTVHRDGTMSFLEYAFAATTRPSSKVVWWGRTRSLVRIPSGSNDTAVIGKTDDGGGQGNSKPQGLRGLRPGVCFEHSSGKEGHRDRVEV